VAQVFSHCPVEAQVQSQVNPYKICGGQSGKETGLARAFWFSPFIVIPPLCRTLSFIYHQHNVIIVLDCRLQFT
jgi:hypothetical protein